MSTPDIKTPLNRAARLSQNCDRVIGACVKELPALINNIECFNGANIVGETFLKGGLAAQINFSSNPRLEGMANGGSYNVLFYKDGTLKVNFSVRAPDGGHTTKETQAWGFADKDKDDVIAHVLMKVASLDKEGFGKFMNANFEATTRTPNIT